jgi:hypothetical protein
MPNWFENKYPTETAKKIRYTASVPIDVWVQDTGDENKNQEEAYNIINEGITQGLNNTAQNGFKIQLYLSDPKRYDKVF